MSRERVPMQDGTLLVLGYDKPFATWYAIHYDNHDEDAPPRAVVGYHPSEAGLLRSERPDAIVGDYPIAEAGELFEAIRGTLRIQAVDLGEQPPCRYCDKPTFKSNPDCFCHPYDRLRYG